MQLSKELCDIPPKVNEKIPYAPSSSITAVTSSTAGHPALRSASRTTRNWFSFTYKKDHVAGGQGGDPSAGRPAVELVTAVTELEGA